MMYTSFTTIEEIYEKVQMALTEDERAELKAMTSKDSHRSQEVLNALILLSCYERCCIKCLLRKRPKMIGSFLVCIYAEAWELSECGVNRTECSNQTVFVQENHPDLRGKTEVNTWQNHMNSQNAQLNWQSTTKDVRIKLRRLFPTSDT